MPISSYMPLLIPTSPVLTGPILFAYGPFGPPSSHEPEPKGLCDRFIKADSNIKCSTWTPPTTTAADKTEIAHTTPIDSSGLPELLVDMVLPLCGALVLLALGWALIRDGRRADARK